MAPAPSIAKGDGTSIPPHRCRDVDPVGAGDAFNAGYLAARLSGAEVSDALVQGAHCGAAVAGVIGDTEGFPRPGEHP